MADLERLIIDTSVITDTWDAEYDTNCHFANIQASYEGFVIWRNIQQVVYTPIFGENLEDPIDIRYGGTRDISTWETTKFVVFITYQISTEIWAPYREFVKEVCETEFTLAYENTTIYNCLNLLLIQDDITIDEFTVTNPSNGNKDVYGWVYKPSIAGAHNRYPAIILVPDARLPGSTEFGNDNPVTGEPDAIYWAKRGYIAIVFDPDFRGVTGTENNQTIVWTGPHSTVPIEDYEGNLNADNGYMQQDGLHAVIQYVSELPEVDRQNIGILSHGWGLALATGALARYPADPPVKFLVDVEGQADRYDVSSDCAELGTVTHLGHLNLHDCTNDDWWEEREPIRHIANIKCRYIRIQYMLDHSQLTIDHAIELIDAATNGDVPFTRINGPENLANVTWTGGIAPLTLETSIPRVHIETQILREQFAFPLLLTERSVDITWDGGTSTTTVEANEYVRLMGNICRSVNLIIDSSYRTFIDAVNIRGYANEFGLCPYTGDLEYLCNRRGYDIEVETIHQSTRHRFHQNINCLNLDTGNQLYTHVPVINFFDEWTLLDGTKRRFSKYNTNIRTFKPLKYHLRMAPPEEQIEPHPLNDYAALGSDIEAETIIRFVRGSFIYYRFEMAINLDDPVLQSLTLDLTYARNNIIQPGDISFYLRSQNEVSAAALPELNLQMILLENYKTPLQCYFNLKKSSESDPIIDPNTLQVVGSDTFTLPTGSAPNNDRWQITSGLPSINEGRLKLTTAQGDAKITSRYMVADNFDISVDGELETTPLSSWWVHALRIRFPDEDDHWCYVGRGYQTTIPQKMIRSRFYKGGANTDVEVHNAASFINRVDYRMIRIGSEISFYYKEHGNITWETLGSIDMYDSPCVVELMMTRGNNNPTAVGYFDNIEVFPQDNVIYDSKISSDDIVVINMDRLDFEYPIDTYGWGMKQKFYFYSHNVEVPPGIYKYTMEFRIKIPTVFGESVFRETFGFNEWKNSIDLQINVR
jgi:hypothetical protein